MKPLLVLSALLVLAADLHAQALPWRRQVEQRLRHQEQLIAQLLQMQSRPQAPPAPILAPEPRQLLPIPGQPQQPLPIPGEPKQPLPVPGEPKQPLPAPGEPKQPLPTPPPSAAPQSYSVRALYRAR